MHARQKLQLTTSVEALEARNLLSVGGTIMAPSLTTFEKAIVRSLDAFVNSHPGALTNFEQAREDLLSAINNPATSSRVVRLEQAALDIVDQVLIDHGEGGVIAA
jgi:hypothetical protein